MSAQNPLGWFPRTGIDGPAGRYGAYAEFIASGRGAPIAQLAEAADLKSAQCRFESDWGHYFGWVRRDIELNQGLPELVSVSPGRSPEAPGRGAEFRLRSSWPR